MRRVQSIQEENSSSSKLGAVEAIYEILIQNYELWGDQMCIGEQSGEEFILWPWSSLFASEKSVVCLHHILERQQVVIREAVNAHLETCSLSLPLPARLLIQHLCDVKTVIVVELAE